MKVKIEVTGPPKSGKSKFIQQIRDNQLKGVVLNNWRHVESYEETENREVVEFETVETI